MYITLVPAFFRRCFSNKHSGVAIKMRKHFFQINATKCQSFISMSRTCLPLIEPSNYFSARYTSSKGPSCLIDGFEWSKETGQKTPEVSSPVCLTAVHFYTCRIMIISPGMHCGRRVRKHGSVVDSRWKRLFLVDYSQ